MIDDDVEKHLFLHNKEIKDFLTHKQPYRQWLENNLTYLSELPLEAAEQNNAAPDATELFARQQLFGYTHEDVELILRPILTDNKEPTWSMGDDAPLAALSTVARSFSD